MATAAPIRAGRPPVPTDHPLRTTRARDRARACHSLVVRMAEAAPADVLERNLALAAATWPDLASLRLWEQTVPADADTPQARERAELEAGRPLRAAAGQVRAVLLRYRDGAADLVLVAERRALPRPVLAAVAAVLTTGTGPAPGELPGVRSGAPVPSGPRAAERAVPDWGLGDPRRAGRVTALPLELPALGRTPEQLVVGAVALALTRYGSGATVRVGVRDLRTDADDRITARTVEVDEGRSVQDYLDRLAGPARPGADAGATEPVTAAVLLDDAAAELRHRPCLAPLAPLTLHWERLPDGTSRGTWWIDEGEVSAQAAARFAAHVARIATWLDAAPADTPLSAAELMTEEEARDVLRAGSTPALDAQAGAGDRTIPQLLAEVVRRQPDAVALVAGTERLTYRQLDERASRMAAGLRALGVRPGAKVGVALERDAELVVALLAVLKAGCAYVPMDLRYPEERLRYTTGNAAVSVVIGVGGRFPAVDGTRVVEPGELFALGEGRGAEAAEPSGDASATAYVIYTSGSTGRPKGVPVPHRNVAALVGATAGNLGLGPEDVWTLFHSSAFDFSVWEIWGCLLTGGRLVVVPYWVTRSVDEFHELLVEQQVTVLNQTPSAFAQLVEADRQLGGDLALRLVVFGGEALDVRMLAKWFARHSHTRCRLVNMFGITETTVHVTERTVLPADVVAGSRSVGRALPGWSLSIRDERGRLLPPGVAGEIHVGGAGVAEGYLGLPELTAERFVTDPLTGERIYRSGDHGRMRPDGSLDHLGRLDSQVKVRGHRIELDEIRSVLLADPAVTGAAVVLSHDVPGDAATARIDAYAVLRDGATARDVLARARSVLPGYMMPTAVTEVASIPLTINGKLDAAKLPAPAPAGQAGAPAQARAREAVEEEAYDPLAEELLKLWSHVLNVEVGPQDNFFELGGNSLLVIRVLREMRSRGLPKVQAQDFYRNSIASQFIALMRELSS
ncbi:amino acid adenylation domain-containing protein [Kitasatospora sp. NPDC094028]